MTTSHTPGDWRVSADGLEVTVSPVGLLTASERICRVESAFKPVQQVRRNAALIAAAPDLLEALKRCRFDSFNMTLDDLKFCRAAVAKATGA